MASKYRGKPIWAADCETDPFMKGRVPEPFIWGAYNGKDYYKFESTEAFVEFITSQGEIIVYGHNAGKFDWHFITDYIEDFEPLTIINGRLAKFSIGDTEFRDSFNIIPAPLSAYKKDEIDYSILEKTERYKPENWEKICDYLKGDCVYLWEMVRDFIEEYGMNLTQAGAAMKMWAKISKVKKPKSSDLYYEEMSKYYYGGRVECFEKGIINGDFSVIDIKSAYPYAMLSNHPWGLNYNTYDYLPTEFDNDKISRCFITVDCDSYGAFPYRSDNGLIFPADTLRRTFHITGWEYLAAKETGTLINHEVKEVREYFDCLNFIDYVTYFYEMKLDAERTGDASRRLFAKLFLNSLYGKFAANPENYQEYMTLPASHIEAASESDGWYFCKLLSHDTAVVNRPLKDEERRYYDVAVSASITGFVRAYLWRSICACEEVLYCDTDSISARIIGNLSFTDKLGDWENEGEFDYGAIGGKKLYAFRRKKGTFNPAKEKPWKIASKGVRLTHDEIISIASGDTITHEPEVPTFSVKRGIVFTPRAIKMTA